MIDSITRWLFDPSGLAAHGFCLLWDPSLVWTHALSDTVIALAYLCIPITLLAVARRRHDLVFKPVFVLFAAFILLCGTEHLLEVVTLWLPAYGLDAVVKVATAAVSAVTAVVLWRLFPQVLALPSPAQLRAANLALQHSEARYRTSFERSPVPVYTLDGAGRVTGMSKSWLDLLGYQSADVLGRSIKDFVPDGWLPEVLDQLDRTGEVRDLERVFIRKDGSPVSVELSARLERPQEEDWIVCAMIDISARRRAEMALRASEDRLHQAQRMETVGQLTGGIAHDFNNMLQGIAGGLDLIERRIKRGQADEAGRYLLMARQSVDRAAGLTHRMLAFARRQALQPRDVSPADLIVGMQEQVRLTLGPGIRLDLALGGGEWHARCDPNQLESALLNLASNARDAMPDGGALTVRLADRAVVAGDLPDQPETEAGDYVEVAVTDTGCGMTPDVLARAFEPFFTTKPTGRGTGLGLSQVYGFVRQSGGAVRLESQPGHGTTVFLFLPRSRPPALPAEDPAARLEGATKSVRGTVLLVEDEDKVREVLAEALQDLGFQVLQAGDGPSGLAILQSRTELDLLLTDIGLPGLNGRQLADAARAHQPKLPVLLITGYAGSALDDMALAPGMELLRKPFALDTLITQLSAMLDGALV